MQPMPILNESTPYPELNQVLREMVRRIQAVLGENLVGVYLQGSFAVGDFDEHSDVDFVVLIQEELSQEQVESLNELHDQVYQLDSEWAKHLEGSYFPVDVFRSASNAGEPVWYLDHGARSMERSNHCNTRLVRRVVREAGVPLVGPAPQDLVDAVPDDDLRREIYAVITEWGAQILEDPEHYNNHFYQAFITLSYCRMLHDLQRGHPGSKRAGAEWAKTHLDPRWNALIDRSWSGRPNPAVSVRRPADPSEYARTLAFVKYVIGETKAYAQAVSLFTRSYL